MDTRIYVCTHKTYTKPGDDLYRTLHVGRKISDDLGYEGDDTGDHISDRNKSFCELTGIYWIWKNVSCDIVGICHYRRYFIKDEDFLKKEDIEEILSSGYDVILPACGFTKSKTVSSHYAKEHYKKDLDTVRSIIAELYPEYIPAFDLSMHCNLISPWNMLITKKEIFQEYCSFIFSVLFEAEKRIDISHYDSFQGRIFGYLSERLIRVWFLMHTYRIYEIPVRQINPEDAYNQHEKMLSTRKLLRLKILDLLTIYKSGNYVNLVEPVIKPIDFHEKIPVWVCWWQGFDNAPALIRLCQKSWQAHLPLDRVEIHEITFENYTSYLTFPDWIMKRYQDGGITLTMLSDMLRMELLSRYGGLWMDATYYLAKKIPPSFFEKSKTFYTIRAEKSHWKTDITEGLWSGNFLRTAPNALLPKFVLNAFYYYFLENEVPVDYFMIDYFIRIAYDEFAQVHEQIDSCPATEPKVMELQSRLADPYTPKLLPSLTENTAVFKLNYRSAPPTETIIGQETLFGHLLHAEGII